MRPAFKPPIESIKFAAQVPKFGADGTYIGTEIRKVSFEIGPGPCGETVTKLEAFETIGWVSVRQVTEVSDKVFKYRVQDIVGRIEIKTLTRTG